MDIFNILTLFGGLSMFLYGMRLMGDSLKESSSGTLKVAIEHVTDNPVKAFVLGFLITAVIQSSTATIVITSGLVGAGILSLHQSLGIIVGANVGTTVTGQIIRLLDVDASSGSFLRLFQPSTLAPVALIIGIICVMALNFKNSKSIGNILLGFGILFSGLLNMTEAVKGIVVKNVKDVEAVAAEVDFCFSAVDMSKDEIRAIEEEYAKTETPVVSNNSAHRWTPDVPMIIPEINPEHAQVIEYQKKRLGTTRGFIAVKPNCSIQSYTPVFAAWKEYEPWQALVSTYQAISGAGKTFRDWPEMEGNIIPYIGGEEEKSEREPLRVFGTIENGVIRPADGLTITSQCIRVPVLYGHTATVFVNLRKKADKEELIEKMRAFRGAPQELGLPSAPANFIQYLEEDNRPQVQLDVNYERGFGVSIGRLRPDTIFDWKFVGLSHNTIRGAAGGGVLCAELLKAQGYIQAK